MRTRTASEPLYLYLALALFVSLGADIYLSVHRITVPESIRYVGTAALGALSMAARPDSKRTPRQQTRRRTRSAKPRESSDSPAREPVAETQ